jgi:hypothetical protein
MDMFLQVLVGTYLVILIIHGGLALLVKIDLMFFKKKSEASQGGADGTLGSIAGLGHNTSDIARDNAEGGAV